MADVAPSFDIKWSARKVLKIMAGPRILLQLNSDGTVEGEVEDAGEAAKVFVQSLRGDLESMFRAELQSLSDRIAVLVGAVNNSWLQWKADELSAEEAMNAIFDATFPSASLIKEGSG